MTIQDLEKLIKRVRAAQTAFARYDQKKVDEIFRQAAISANNQRIPPCKACG